MATTEYVVLGVDPASSKGATVFDGSAFRHLWPGEVASHLLGSQDALLCWDAPLTGPPSESAQSFEGDLCTRVIEKYLGGGEVRWTDAAGHPLPRTLAWKPAEGRDATPPTGISVRGFSGLSHWTVTRRVLGLPRVGPLDKPLEELPARLLVSRSIAPPHPDPRRPSVVEVHPAVALWLWLRDVGDVDWAYKKSNTSAFAAFEKLKGVLLEKSARSEKCFAPVRAAMERLDSKVEVKTGPGTSRQVGFSDDHLDAFIAWTLGVLWTRQSADDPSVLLVGDLEVGAMLLPASENLTPNLGERFRTARSQALSRMENGRSS